MSNYSFNPLYMALKHLYEQAKQEDALFAQEVAEKESRTDNPKSLKECADYIMGEAYDYAANHKNGNFGLAGCDDDQIKQMIKHYYDEDNITIKKVGSSAKASVKTTSAQGGNKTAPAANAKGNTKGNTKDNPMTSETLERILRNPKPTKPTPTITELTLF